MKTLFILCLTLLSVLPASALPAELYLVGNFNDWTTPDQDKAPYILMPTGTAGTYSGTFDIPAQNGALEFRVYDAKTNLDSDSYGKVTYIDSLLFSNVDIIITLSKREHTDNARITNWIGGKITMSCTLDERYDKALMTITSPDQPTTPVHPDDFWVIGDFNNWEIPSDTSDNGAIKLKKSNHIGPFSQYYDKYPYIRYKADNVAIPSGKARFVFYYVDPVDNKAKYIGGDKYLQATGVFQEYITLSLSDLPNYTYDNIDKARDNAIHIVNFTGPDLSFDLVWNFETYAPDITYIYWKKAPLNNLINKGIYLYIEDLDTNKEYIIPQEGYFGKPVFNINIKNKVKIWLTESDKLPLTQKWGPYSDTDVTVNHGTSAIEYIIPDGNPIICNPGDSVIKFRVSLDRSHHQIQVTSEPSDYYYAKRLYISGYMSNYIEPVEENADLFQTLPRVADGVFEGLVYFPAQKSQRPLFGLHYRLEGWQHSGTIGPDYKGFGPVKITFTDSKFTFPVRLYLQEFWELQNWESRGNVKMRVDLNTWEMTLTNLSTNSVEGIESEEMNAPVDYFNLQGQRVLNPSNGIYIRVQGAKSEKVILE